MAMAESGRVIPGILPGKESSAAAKLNGGGGIGDHKPLFFSCEKEGFAMAGPNGDGGTGYP